MITLFGKKKTKSEQPITPEELGRLNDKQTQNPTIRKYHVATDSAQIMGLKKRRKILGIILGAVTAVLAILFIISMLVTKWGDLVIEIDRPAVAKGFTLSESKDFESKSVSLSAKQALDVTNITYNWLPTDLDTSKDGEHNGENYVAYTFYLRNDGEEAIDYDAVLDITGVAKSADEAVRVMVYKNGEPSIFAKGRYDDREQAETDATKFESDTVVMSAKSTDFKVGDVDKYTVVIWIEGNDSECIDDIRDGYVRMRMLFKLDDPDATQSPFGDYYNNGKLVDDTKNYKGYTVYKTAIPKYVDTKISFYRLSKHGDDVFDGTVYNAWHTYDGADSSVRYSGWKILGSLASTRHIGSTTTNYSHYYAIRGNGYGTVAHNDSNRYEQWLSPCIGYWGTETGPVSTS